MMRCGAGQRCRHMADNAPAINLLNSNLLAILEGFSEIPKGFTFLCQFKRHHELAGLLMGMSGAF